MKAWVNRKAALLLSGLSRYRLECLVDVGKVRILEGPWKRKLYSAVDVEKWQGDVEHPSPQPAPMVRQGDVRRPSPRPSPTGGRGRWMGEGEK